jgi:glycerol kinase
MASTWGGKGCIIAIDQSTQATKAVLFDRAGRPARRVTLPHRQIYPAAGFVEHDPLEILANAKAAALDLVRESGVPPSSIAALSITNQRETVLAWDSATGKPVHNALVWQDGRGAGLCERLAAEGLGPTVKARTGLRLDPYFSASKLAWIARESGAARSALAAGRLMAGTVDAWLIWNLTGGEVFATDYSNASRTMLFDIRKLEWDRELLGAFGIEGIRLPEPRCSDADFGIAEIEGLGAALPIAGVMGDSHAALFGHCGWRPGDAKATYGTGSSIMSNIGRQPADPGEGLVLSLAWGREGRAEYVFEGNIHSTGYTMRWLRDNLGLFSDYAEAELEAVEAGGNGGVYLVPAFSGLGAPYWEHGISAIVTGLSHGSDRRHLIRAGLESIAFQVRDLVEEMDARSGAPLAQLHVDGGPTRNAFLMQFQADLLGIPVTVPEVEELSALGAAYMGGMARGLWAGPEEVAALPVAARKYLPRMEAREREALVAAWKSAVAQAMSRKIDTSARSGS